MTVSSIIQVEFVSARNPILYKPSAMIKLYKEPSRSTFRKAEKKYLSQEGIIYNPPTRRAPGDSAGTDECDSLPKSVAQTYVDSINRGLLGVLSARS